VTGQYQGLSQKDPGYEDDDGAAVISGHINGVQVWVRHRIKIHIEGPLTSEALKFLSFEVFACRITHVGRHFPSQSMTFSGQ
jgi:hypothetical protein